MAAHSVALLLLSSLAAASAATYGHTVGWQSHGRNDIREWVSGIVKGNDVWKLDYAWANTSYCVAQPTVLNRTDSRGCIVFIHTLTNAGRGAVGAWSSDSVLSWMKAVGNRKFLKSPYPRQFFALNFKNSPSNPCDGSQYSANWLSLTDDFYAASFAIIDRYNLNMEFYVDQLQNRPCMWSKWPRWISTWDNGSVPLDGRVFDNNSTLGHDRYQLYNRGESISQIQLFAANQFFKFKNSSYPLVFYEPEDQYVQEFITDIYLSAGIDHTPGFRFASNADSVQQALWTATRSKKAIHVTITNDTKFNPLYPCSYRVASSLCIWPQLAVLDTSAKKDGSVFMAIVGYTNNVQVNSYITLKGTAPQPDRAAVPAPRWKFNNFTTLTQASLPAVGDVKNNHFVAATALWLGSTAYYFLGTRAGFVNIFTINTVTGALTPSGSPTQLISPVTLSILSNPLARVNGLLGAVANVPGSNTTVYVLGVATGYDAGYPVENLLGACNVDTQLFILDVTTNSGSPVGPPTCLTMDTTPQTGALNMVVAAPSSQCYVAGKTTLEVVLSTSGGWDLNMATITSQTFVYTFCVDAATGSVSNIIPSPSQPRTFTVGDFPSVAMTKNKKGESVTMVVNTNNFCWTSYMRDDTYLGYQRTCESFTLGYGAPQTGVMNYAYGRTSVLNNKLKRASPKNIVTNFCDPELLHGTFDQGYQPSAALIQTPSTLVAVVVSVGTQSFALNDCGAPNPSDGLVLDVWAVPNLL